MELNAFVYGTMDIKDTNNLFEGKNVFLKASGVSVLEKREGDIQAMKDFMSENIRYADYNELHHFCTDFIQCDMLGLIGSEEVEELIDE